MSGVRKPGRGPTPGVARNAFTIGSRMERAEVAPHQRENPFTHLRLHVRPEFDLPVVGSETANEEAVPRGEERVRRPEHAARKRDRARRRATFSRRPIPRRRCQRLGFAHQQAAAPLGDDGITRLPKASAAPTGTTDKAPFIGASGEIVRQGALCARRRRRPS